MKSMMRSLLLVLALTLSVSAQFQFFEQFFGGEQQQARDVPSDSSWYQQNYAKASCSNYLCPDTLACVHFPHHCPCAFPQNEDKVELGDGIAICASKGGYKAGETVKKIKLARKGLL